MAEKKLVVYFSRVGEQYSVGKITEGNTAIMAQIIAQTVGGDLFEVKLKDDHYPAGYDALTKVAKQEKQQAARPLIAGDVAHFEQYATVFIGGPVWWGDLPMAMYSFIEQHGWAKQKIFTFATHEGSGMGHIDREVAAATKLSVQSSLALYGHQLQNDRAAATAKIQAWLKTISL